MALVKDHDTALLEREWTALQAGITGEVRARLARTVEAAAPGLVQTFYSILQADPEANRFLSHEMVQTKLRHTLRGWLLELFPGDQAPEFTAMATRQLHVGEIHARVNLPIKQVYRSWRMLNDGLIAGIVAEGADPETLVAMLRLAANTMNIAVEIMGAAFSRENSRAERNEEAYRLFSLGQNLTQEREAQRAAIAEWVQNTLFSVAAHAGVDALPALGASEFGLWLTHRGAVVFSGMAEMQRIAQYVQEIDRSILPGIRAGADAGPALIRLQARINEIKSLLGDCFNAAARIEGGRDPLTRMLNRRFMDTVLSREVAFTRQMDRALSVVMIDLDHFKRVNDQHGHASGDAVLKQCAEVVLEAVRIGDFVFRYGGEEFLVVLVETRGREACLFAERVRESIARTPIDIGDGKVLSVTASIGVAEFSGHPDYMKLVNAADGALYRAKSGGRNQVCLAEAG
ncbi:diguanylate cyclase [Segnochrobactraceae bacterium EtOH-i3]